MHKSPTRPSAAGIRAQFVLETAAAYASVPGQRVRQATVQLRDPGSTDPPLCLSASSTYEGIDAVVAGDAALAIMNPSAGLTLAYRGTGRYRTPQPVRVLTVIPSFDRCALALRPDSPVSSFEDVARRKYPLQLAVRAQRDHYLQELLEHVAAAAGFSLADLESWGGALHYMGSSPPRAGDARFAAVERGDVEGIFDEGVFGWISAALEAGMRIAPLAETTVQALEARGYRRGTLARSDFPRLEADVLSLDFSGWAVFVRDDLPAATVVALCEAMEERKAFMAWEGGGPMPIERMWRDGPDTPRDVPLHPAAESYWRTRFGAP